MESTSAWPLGQGASVCGVCVGVVTDWVLGTHHALSSLSLFLSLLPLPRDSTKTTLGFKKATTTNIDYLELLQHFERVQNKHLEVRHQRVGRGEPPDRRVVL